MTVSTATSFNSYAGNGSTTSFAYAFKIFQDSNLVVTLVNDTTGVETTQTLTTDYTVTGAGSDSGGNVVFGTAPASGNTAVIRRVLPVTQETNYVPNDPFPAEAHEDALDKLTMLVQQEVASSELAVQFPEGDVGSGINNILPSVTGRSDKLLKFGLDGGVEVIAASDLSNAIIGANYSVDTFTGTGSTTVYTLSAAPGSKANAAIYIDGVYQAKANYSVSGSTLTFTTAPPLNSAIEIVIGDAIPAGAATTASAVSYTQGGTGAVTTNVQAKLRETVSVKDFGAVGDGVADDTAAFNSAIAASNYIYIPEGTYLVNITLDAKRGYTFKGAGRDVTNLKNFTDSPVFTLDASSGDCKFNVFEGFRIINRDKAVYTNAIGFYQIGSGALECDFNEFRSLEIVSMKHGFQFTSRSIWNSFEDVHVYDSISDGFKAVVTDNCSGFSFRQCRFGQNGGHGMYVSKDSGDLLANWTFNNVTFEKNNLTGLYVGGTSCGIQGWMLMGCYFEENTKTVAASATAPRKANIFIDAQSCYGLVVDACSLYGTPLATALDWGIYISSTNATGRIGPNRTGVYTLGAVSTTGSFMVEQQAGGTTGLVLGAGSKDFTKLVEEVTGDFTVTLTGVTATVTGTARYVRNTNQVTLYIPLLEGTSNTTAATLTGMPSGIQPTRTQNVVCITKDNGVSAAALAQIPSTGIIALYKDVGGGSFTASGTKGIQAITLTYALD